MPGTAALPPEIVREALRLAGQPEPAGGRAQAIRALREAFAVPGAVRSLVDRAPPGARAAFVRLVQDGPAPVEELLGRGWWGHGTLPPPLDWLQRRGLITTSPDGLVHAVDEARSSFLDLALDLTAPDEAGEMVRVEPAAAVVVTATPQALDRVLTVPGTGLRGVAPTVAISEQPPAALSAALRTAGIVLAEDTAVTSTQHEPALPTAAEDAVGPRAVRAVLERAVGEERQVRLQYFASSRGGAATDRVVDPWSFRDDLLRGWCHLRLGERTFAVDRIGHARLLPSPIEHRER